MAGEQQQEQQEQQQEQHNGVVEAQHESPRTAMFVYSGVLFPSNIHSAETLGYAREFPVRPDDLFVVTYPKSGTTWMQEIVTLVYSDGDLGPVQTVPNWERVPWLEQDTGRKHLEHRASPRLITTHLPFQLAPREIGQAKAKVIYMARNPRDILVSSYNFHKIAHFLEEPGTWEEFYDKFCKGKGLGGGRAPTVPLRGPGGERPAHGGCRRPLPLLQHEGEPHGQLLARPRAVDRPQARQLHAQGSGRRLEDSVHGGSERAL
uniref:Sulfotransferase n=1 Tax=Petromyzon marinus TaxID=7757 RepID=A0AAJ7U0S9_PETMA|nr:bile salt sulfotransferase-like isoform X2 [Petromyzon marinus]